MEDFSLESLTADLVFKPRADNHLESNMLINLFKDQRIIENSTISTIISYSEYNQKINLDVFVGLYLNPKVNNKDREKILQIYLTHATQYHNLEDQPILTVDRDNIYYLINQIFKNEEKDVSSKINALIEAFTKIFPERMQIDKSTYENLKHDNFVDIMIYIINHPDLTKDIFLKIYSYLNNKKFNWNSLFNSTVKLNHENKEKLIKTIEETRLQPTIEILSVMNRARNESHQQKQVKQNTINDLPTDVLLLIYSYYYQHDDNSLLYYKTDKFPLRIIDKNTKLRDFLLVELENTAKKQYAKLNPESKTKPSMLDCLLLPFSSKRQLSYKIPNAAVPPNTAPAPPHKPKQAWQ